MTETYTTLLTSYIRESAQDVVRARREIAIQRGLFWAYVGATGVLALIYFSQAMQGAFPGVMATVVTVVWAALTVWHYYILQKCKRTYAIASETLRMWAKMKHTARARKESQNDV